MGCEINLRMTRLSSRTVHPTTKAPETQIYFINHRSGAFPVLRLRTVVRGERASRSIVNRTTVLWSTWGVSSPILAGLGSEPLLYKRGGGEVAVPRGSNGSSNLPSKYSGVMDGLYM